MPAFVFFVISLVVIAETWSLGAAQDAEVVPLLKPSKIPGGKEYDNFVERITILHKAGDIRGLEALSIEVVTNKPHLTRLQYYVALSKIVKAMGSIATNAIPSAERESIRKKIADAALGDGTEIPLDLGANLIFASSNFPSIQVRGVPFSEEKFALSRRTQAELWLTLWQRFDRAIDRNFVFKTYVTNSILDQRVLENPELLRQRQMERAKTEEAIRRDDRERLIRKWEESHRQAMEVYLGGVYTYPPEATGELTELLNKFAYPKDRREALLQGVIAHWKKETASREVDRLED